jgi:hypothetical protein
MELPDISGLPQPAQIVFVCCFAVVGALAYFGVIHGRNTPAGKRTDASEIVALTVDSRSIDKLAGEAAGVSVALTELKVAVVESSKDLVRSNDDLVEQIRDLAVEMRVSREVGRAHKN